MKTQLLTDIHQKLKNQDTNLTLDQDTICSERIVSQWKTFLKSETLSISNADISEQDSEGNFSISGTTQLLNFEPSPVKISFFLSQDSLNSDQSNVECLIELNKIINSWNLTQDYPNLPGYIDYSPSKISEGIQPSFLQQIEFNQVTFIFSSFDFAEAELNPDNKNNTFTGTKKLAERFLKAGINFTANIEAKGDFWNSVKYFKDDLDQLHVLAQITDDSGLLLTVRCPFENSTFQISSSLSVTLDALIIKSGLTANSYISPSFAIESHIASTQHTLNLTINITIGSNSASISGSFADGKTFGLGNLLNTLGISGLDLSSDLPNDTSESSFGSLGLRDLKFELALSPLEVNSIAFSLAAENPWSILDSKISIQPIMLWEIQSPFNSQQRDTLLEIIGIWKLGETTINVYGLPLRGDIVAEMAEGETLDIDQLFESLLPSIPIPDISLVDMSFEGNYRDKTFYLELQADTDFNFDLGFTTLSISEVGMWAEYDGEKITTWSFAGELILAKVRLQIHANYNAGSGWFFSGETFSVNPNATSDYILGGGDTLPDDTIKFGSLFTNLLDGFENISGSSLPVNIPEDYLDISVSGLFVGYYSEDKTLELYANLIFAIEITDSFSIDTLTIYLLFDSNGISSGSSVQLKLTIAEVEIILASQKLEGDKEWLFSGSTGDGQAIPIGDAITDIANKFGVDQNIPSAIKDLTIQNLGIFFNTKTKDFTFTCQAKFPVDNQEVDITVTIAITRQQDNSFNKEFTGYIIVNNLQFNLIFSKDNKSKTLLATYKNSNGDSLIIKTLIADISNDIATYIPASLQITLKDALFIYNKPTKTTTNNNDRLNKSNFLFGLNLSSQVNLTNLPLVGKQFPPEQTINIDDLQFIIAAQQLTTETVDNFNNLIPENITKIPLQQRQETTEEKPAINKGLNLSANLNFGDTTQTLALPIASESTPTTDEDKTSTAVTQTDNTQWYPLNTTFGPLYFARIGIQYEKEILWFLLDASISSAGLTLTLEGLSVGSPITKFSPKFNLRGIGIEYESKGNLSIGGSLLRTTVNGKDEYSGSIIVQTKTFTISAIGSYTTTEEGHPSLFVYGVLDKPIGGPPFLFITGIALGFAYNRSFIAPSLEEIPQFPLVRAAINGGKANVDELMEIQQQLRPYIPPKQGQVMLAVGVKFTSFKIIESFVLLVATFGEQFALDLIGISTLTSPPALPSNSNVPPLAQVRLAILARFVPSEGTLKVEGKILPDSYLFDRDCQLSGGFAFYSWFSGEHEGDFVLTVGGYHPRFNIPQHYPKVDPISVNWRISNELTIKGSMYFALTASAIMAGGRLEAVWQSGNLKAWFIADAHFIVAWQPYFYDAQISLRLGVSYTFNIKIWFVRIRKTISIDVGANLHIWGPEFSGIATINLSIVSFTVRFGSSSQKKPQPLTWKNFKGSFLPADEKVCSIAVESGLLRKIETEEIFVVNPKEFLIATASVIPIKTSNTGKGENKNSIGIAPMNVSPSKFTQSEYTIYIYKNDKKSDQFSFEPIYKNIPTALWGESNSNDPNRERFINNVLSGYKIKPANPPTPGETQPIERKNLAYDTESVDNAYQWNSFSGFSKDEEIKEDTRERNIGKTITSEAVKNARQKLLESLELSDTDLDLEEFTTDKGIEQAFIIAPQLQETM